MLNRLIAFSLTNRLFVCLTGVLLAIAGLITAVRMPVDVLPDLNRPTVTIMSEAHAMVPEDVEQLVTLPLEQMLSGATGVQRVRSSSGLGLSVIHVEFAWNTDIFINRQIVQEKLQLARQLMPEGVTPVMAPISSIMGQIQLVGVYSKTEKTPIDAIRALVDNDLRYRISSISGVSKVIIMGGAPRQLQVTVNEEKLRIHGVTIKEVAEAVHKSNMNAGGGFLNLGKKAPVITVTGLLENPNDLKQAVVRFDPLRPVLISDVADVQFGPALTRIGDAGINGKPGVIMVIMKQPGSDTILLTDSVNEILHLSEAGLANDLEIIPDLFQQAAFIHRAVENVMAAVRDGGILVVIILFLFLANLRTTLITLTAIPLSLAVTALVFQVLGIGINTMTLGGIAVAIGALVDDAIVDMENIFRRLKENRLRPESERQPALKVIFRASCEVRKAIWIGTLLVSLVYVPLFFLTGLEGRLFTPIGIAYIVSIMASLVVALTVTPAMCYYLLPAYVNKQERAESWMVKRLKTAAEKSIRFSIRHGNPVLISLVLLVCLGLYGLSTRGTDFLPAFDEGVAQINLFLPPDTGLDASNAYGRTMEETIMSVQGVRSVARRTGRAAGDEHAEGVNVSEAIVTMDPGSGRSRSDIIADIRTQLAEQLPGI
ncbi:MAG: Cu/Ag efflux pump CusA, partial [Kiritimatiellia bacterium]